VLVELKEVFSALHSREHIEVQLRPSIICITKSVFWSEIRPKLTVLRVN
jgi:hypothetical protein